MTLLLYSTTGGGTVGSNVLARATTLDMASVRAIAAASGGLHQSWRRGWVRPGLRPSCPGERLTAHPVAVAAMPEAGMVSPMAVVARPEASAARLELRAPWPGMRPAGLRLLGHPWRAGGHPLRRAAAFHPWASRERRCRGRGLRREQWRRVGDGAAATRVRASGT